MGFTDYYELDDVKLELPVGGKVYRVPPITAEAGIKLEAGEEMTNGEFLVWTLGGELVDELRTDKVPMTAIGRMAFTSYANHTNGREVAEQVWNMGSLPKALTPESETESPPTPSTGSPSTASASETPKPASTRPTTSRPATPPRKRSPRAKTPRSS